MAEPFDDGLGADPSLREWANNDRSARRVAKAAKEKLDSQMDLRNEIAHGNNTMTVLKSDFEAVALFFKALTKALASKVQAELALI